MNIDILSEQFVCQLHKQLFGKVWHWAGVFRSTAKNIGVDSSMIAIELRKLLDDCRYWLDKSIFEHNEIAIRLHHRMVWIHPFANGNGRHARIMADALLTRQLGKVPLNWANGFNLNNMNERRKQYILALRAGDKGDYSKLIGLLSSANIAN
jgi:Fic-DOC domain mobile mystery protein B